MNFIFKSNTRCLDFKNENEVLIHQVYFLIQFKLSQETQGNRKFHKLHTLHKQHANGIQNSILFMSLVKIAC